MGNCVSHLNRTRSRFLESTLIVGFIILKFSANFRKGGSKSSYYWTSASLVPMTEKGAVLRGWAVGRVEGCEVTPLPTHISIRPGDPLLVASGDHWRPVQTCSFRDHL